MYTPYIQQTMMPMMAQTYVQPMMSQPMMSQPMMYQPNMMMTQPMQMGIPQPVYKQISVGPGIDMNEYNKIVGAATNCYTMKRLPLSTSVTSTIKAMLGGEWVCVVTPVTKNYDFCCSMVKGADYMTFSLDNTLFQICRLR